MELLDAVARLYAWSTRQVDTSDASPLPLVPLALAFPFTVA